MDKNTKRLWDAIKEGATENERPVLPIDFIDGLRRALEAGLSCDEIVSFLILSTGFHESMRRMSGVDAIDKALSIVKIMKRDIDIENCFTIIDLPKP